jgi:hypothetical protein
MAVADGRCPALDVKATLNIKQLYYIGGVPSDGREVNWTVTGNADAW